MANKKFVVELSREERERLDKLIRKGKASAKIILKARILLKADQGEAGEGWRARYQRHDGGAVAGEAGDGGPRRCAYPQEAEDAAD